MSTHGPAIVLALIVATACTALARDTAPSTGTPKPQAKPTAALPAKEKDASRSSGGEAKGPRDPLLKLLDDAAEAVNKVQAEAAKNSDDPFPIPLFVPFEVAKLREETAGTLRAIGAARAALGDREGARKNWQTATLLAGKFFNATEKVSFLTDTAAIQEDAGDHEEAIKALHQAALSARPVEEPKDGRRMPRFLHDDPKQSQVIMLFSIARTYDRLGVRASARQAYAETLPAIEALTDPEARISALAEFAAAQPPSDAPSAWKRALDFALSIGDELAKADALETVVRARFSGGDADEVLRFIRDEVKGDLQAYLVWSIADELGASDGKPEVVAVKRVLAMIESTTFDHVSKKAAALIPIVRAQVRAGDLDGAAATLNVIRPDEKSSRIADLYAQVDLMYRIARARMDAGARDAAVDLAEVALEQIQYYLYDGASGFPVSGLAVLVAEGTNVDAAFRITDQIVDRSSKINVLLAVAAFQNRKGDKTGARKTVEKALRIVDGIPNESLWNTTRWTGDDRGRRPFTQRGGRRFPGLSRSTFAQSRVFDVLGTIATTQARIGDVAGALKTAGRIKVDGYSGRSEATETYAVIIGAQMKENDFAGALKTLESIPLDNYPSLNDRREQVMSAIAKAQVKAGDAAAVLAWSMKQPSPESKLFALQALAEGIAELKAAKKSGTSRRNTPAQTGSRP